MRSIKWMALVGTVVLALTMGSLVSSEAAEDWTFQVTPYLWTAGMNGEIGSAGQTAIVDIDFQDMIGLAEIGLAGAFKASFKDDWTILVEGMYVEMAEGGTSPEGVRVNLDADIGLGSFVCKKRIVDNLDVFAGGRYTYMKTVVGLSQGPTVNDTQDWVDPIIGFTIRGVATEKLLVALAMDVGGFGVNSDFTYHMAANVSYAFDDTYSVVFGYRLLDIEYDKDGFVYDAKQDGLLFGLGIAF